MFLKILGDLNKLKNLQGKAEKPVDFMDASSNIQKIKNQYLSDSSFYNSVKDSLGSDMFKREFLGVMPIPRKIMEQSSMIAPLEQPTQEQPTQEQPTQEQPTQEQPTQEQPTQEQPSLIGNSKVNEESAPLLSDGISLEDLWKREDAIREHNERRADSSYTRLVKDLLNAGINPNLINISASPVNSFASGVVGENTLTSEMTTSSQEKIAKERVELEKYLTELQLEAQEYLKELELDTSMDIAKKQRIQNYVTGTLDFFGRLLGLGVSSNNAKLMYSGMVASKGIR